MPVSKSSIINQLFKMQKSSSISFYFISSSGVSTKHQGKIIDINTKETIPYANILINKSESIISMERYTFRKQ
jgi:hypothetical protein